METTFLNLTVTVEAASPADAYAQLCTALATIECNWQTDAYTTDGTPDEQRSTEELFPPG